MWYGRWDIFCQEQNLIIRRWAPGTSLWEHPRDTVATAPWAGGILKTLKMRMVSLFLSAQALQQDQFCVCFSKKRTSRIIFLYNDITEDFSVGDLGTVGNAGTCRSLWGQLALRSALLLNIPHGAVVPENILTNYTPSRIIYLKANFWFWSSLKTFPCVSDTSENNLLQHWCFRFSSGEFSFVWVLLTCCCLCFHEAEITPQVGSKLMIYK